MADDFLFLWIKMLSSGSLFSYSGVFVGLQAFSHSLWLCPLETLEIDMLRWSLAGGN